MSLADLAGGTGADARAARRTLKRRAATGARGGADDFAAPLINALDDLAARIAPDERRRLAGEVADDLRASNVKRLRANLQPPDDAAMTARKPQLDKKTGKHHLRSKRLRDPGSGKKTSVKTGRMFQRAASAKYLRKESSAGEAAVGFVGAMARIMRVHQYGEVDAVTRGAGAPRVKYPARVVLGFDHADRARILDQVTAAIAG